MTTDPLATVITTDYTRPMTGFAKLFSTIVNSTIWREAMHVKVVWVTMLAMAERDGTVPTSLPGLADAARVTLDQCQDAIARLLAPDPHSRTKAHEGRRIEPVDGGWRILNYPKYREKIAKDERRIQVREAVRRHRAKVAAEETPAFVEAMQFYPTRPNNSRAAARRQWHARVAAGEDEQAMLDGTRRYAAYIAATGTEPQYVKMAATFYGRDQHYKNDYRLPVAGLSAQERRSAAAAREFSEAP